MHNQRAGSGARLVYLAYFAYFAYITSSHRFLFTDWEVECQSAIVYERHEQAQVLNVIPQFPLSSILGRLPLVPVGRTGTIPFEMQLIGGLSRGCLP